MLQPEPRTGEGCNTLSHEGLANVNIRKGMLYRHLYIYAGGLDGGGGGSGIHFSLKFSPLFISLKFWVIH